MYLYYVPFCEPCIPVHVARPVEALDYLEARLAPGSHVVLVGLIDAGFLYKVGGGAVGEEGRRTILGSQTLPRLTPPYAKFISLQTSTLHCHIAMSEDIRQISVLAKKISPFAIVSNSN